MGVSLVVQSHLQGLFKDLDDVGAIGSGHKFKWATYFSDKVVASLRDLLVHIDFVGDDHARDVGALLSHLLVPIPQVLVSYLSLRIEHEHGDVSAVVVRAVQLVK